MSPTTTFIILFITSSATGAMSNLYSGDNSLVSGDISVNSGDASSNVVDKSSSNVVDASSIVVDKSSSNVVDASSNVVDKSSSNVVFKWEQYKLKYSKVYRNYQEEKYRFLVWKENVEMIEEHNSRENSYSMAANQFTDWTNIEFHQFLGFRETKHVSKGNVSEYKSSQPRVSSVDYRKDGLVTGVKDQESCGSCWAFSATGGIEGTWAKATGQLVQLSEQQLMDCGKYAGRGCSGGAEQDGWESVLELGGIMSEEEYPYEANDDNQCRFQPESVVAHIAGFVEKGLHGEDELETTLSSAGSPVSVAIYAGGSFQHYSEGVYDDPECSQHMLNHAVLVVGYDRTEEDDQFWIVKNSWGSEWGEDGYVRMRMGINVCSIAIGGVYYPYM